MKGVYKNVATRGLKAHAKGKSLGDVKPGSSRPGRNVARGPRGQAKPTLR